MDDVEGIANDSEQVVEGTVHEGSEEVVAALNQVRDAVQAMHMDVRALVERGNSPMDVHASTEEHAVVGGEEVQQHTSSEDHSDPYLRERRPVRKHPLFRRIFE